MQFSLVSDPPGTSLQDRALKARNELVSKLLSDWPRLAEVQLLYYEPGTTSAFQRLPHSLNCMVEDHDRYVPNIDDEGINGDEKLYLQYLQETRQDRARVAKNLADAIIRACQDAYEELPRARTFEARVMLYDGNGSIEPGPTQKFPASALGQIQTSDVDSDDDALERPGGPIDELVRTIRQLVTDNAAGSEQMRIEKSDIHQRYIELTDKNMGMLDKFQSLVEMALTHSQLPPEHYDLEATKLQMRLDSQKAAMNANTKAAMAHERQQTVQAFIKENPNFLQDLLATVSHLYQTRAGAPADAPPHGDGDCHDDGNNDDDVVDTTATNTNPTPPRGNETAPSATSASEATSDPGTSRSPGASSTPASGAPGASPTSGANGRPSLCPASRKLHKILDKSTVKALHRNLAPDHWRALEPLLMCTSEAEFRLHINRLTGAFALLSKDGAARFKAGLLESVPLPARGPLAEYLGSYGLRIL